MRGWAATLLVARREARERSRSKAFLASTAVTVLLLGAVVAVVALTDSGPPTYDVALLGDNPASLRDSLDAAATVSDVLLNVTDASNPEAVASAIEAGDLDGAVLGGDTIVLGDNPPQDLEALLSTGLRQAVLLQSLTEAGLDQGALERILEPGSISVVTASEDGEDGTGVAVAAIVLLFVVITTYGQWVLMGVLEEKSTRVVELIVSSTSVRSLLAGKVIGIGLLGMAQMVLLIALGLGAGTLLDLFALPSGTLATAAWSLLWFVLGFAFYAVLYAAAGSLVSRSEDAQAAATPIALVGVASYLLTFAVILPNPDSAVSVTLSLLPPVAPIAFPARVGFGGVAAWQLIAGVVVMALAVVGVVRLAARIYAGALLASGGRIKIREAWRSAGELGASSL